MKKFFLITYIFFVVCFFVPSIAFAYLDPGTGNALIYVILSLAGAALYFVKGLFYKLTGNKQAKSSQPGFSGKDIVIFSEGKSYWNVFRPVVEKLIEKKQPFSYLTMDIDDPCLLIDDDYMDNQLIGDGHVAYYKISNIHAGILLTTTPNIGTEGFPITRSSHIKKLVFLSHAAFDDFAYYHKGSVDHYDVVMLVGGFAEPIIRRLELLRGLPQKELVPAGLPYLDNMIQKQAEINSKPETVRKFMTESEVTVLLAPSWGEKGFLRYYKTDFIKELAEKGFNLIIRPHPQSLKVEVKLLRHVEEELKEYDNVLWDFRPDGSDSLQKADIMISDTSAIRFDFALVHQKPFITLPITMTEEALQGFELADMEYCWREEAFKSIGYGYTLNKNELNRLSEIIMKILHEKDNDKILELRDRNIYNLGSSGTFVAEYLINQAAAIKMESN